MSVYTPREDSRLLAKQVLEKNIEGKKCLDIGTGTGIIAEKMAKSGAEKTEATDTNPEALKKAEKKLKKYENVEIHQSDLFEQVHGKFDLICFNPPYLPESNEDKDTEGEETWNGGESGKELTEKFLDQADKYLKENGEILFVVSSLSDFRVDGYDVIDTKKLWFEDIYVLKTK